MNPSFPFERASGNSQQVAMYNRIGALARIKHLTGVSLAKKSPEYKKLIDAELYTRWYKDYPQDHVIDEQWCQHVAIVVKELEGIDTSILEQESDERVKQLFREAQLKPSIPTELNKVSEPEKISLFKRIITWTWNKQ